MHYSHGELFLKLWIVLMDNDFFLKFKNGGIYFYTLYLVFEFTSIANILLYNHD